MAKAATIGGGNSVVATRATKVRTTLLNPQRNISCGITKVKPGHGQGGGYGCQQVGGQC